LPDQAIRDGVRQIEWPARLQTLTQGPLKRALPGWTLTLDGGHNAAAGLALADEIARWDRSVPVHVICGMMNSKAAVDFLRPFAPLIASFQAVTIPGEENSFSATDLCAMAQEAGLPDPSTAESVLEASERLARRQQGGHLLICGSLYLAGRLLGENS
ncbi:MAG TPA: bifunctional folylpolyglutamate synthase/dihydrofolate synthase, partial [Rhodospirillaceae bacterium]|nr:bifunctional folylpolyglutamate synthase/dihydrofolate synthase [Rhodospirillaceae bacterium]